MNRETATPNGESANERWLEYYAQGPPKSIGNLYPVNDRETVRSKNPLADWGRATSSFNLDSAGPVSKRSQRKDLETGGLVENAAAR